MESYSITTHYLPFTHVNSLRPRVEYLSVLKHPNIRSGTVSTTSDLDRRSPKSPAFDLVCGIEHVMSDA